MRQAQTSKIFFRTLTIIYSAMLLGQLAFISIVIFLKLPSGRIDASGFSFPFSVVLPFLTITCLIASSIVYRVLVKSAQLKEKLVDKMPIYQSALIVKLALIEGPSLFSVVIFLMTGQVYFLIFTLILLLIFITSKPGRQKAIDELKLDMSESELVRNDDSIICQMQSKFQF
ncbi:hypothetical protein E9993_06930 [Labilibacter sediminis]|nr:hypothetical protein E9993_06930 [Labilibacter sediminis]